jgi:hypothetical protein
MTEENTPQLWSGRSIASHLEVELDPNNPPPHASPSFVEIRQQASSIWKAFEAAENDLVQLDDKVLEQILEYISSHQRATAEELEVERSRITIQIHQPRIVEAVSRCQELEEMVTLLEQAALREPETVEARATLKIDVGVMRKVLETTQKTIQVAQIQMNKAIAMLNVHH